MVVRTAANRPEEQATRDRVLRLQSQLDLAPWTFASEVLVDATAQPHSHPVLTIDAVEDDELLLAAILHEQLHWFEDAHADRTDAAIEATRVRWPDVPTQRPGGAGSEESTRLHLLVCHWEHLGLECLRGPKVAAAVIGRISEHHYGWVYRTVLAERALLTEISVRHGLLPPGAVTTVASSAR
ncbi:hypothetical protein [Nocardioides aequoreus]|uniref:hypothetical protein n=1 Tax=Nocardioides aequoreus TaxID=397278 RepID=UPI0012F6C726|nr:hypothetical protein [Nocardioides aequoreus]